MLSLNDKVYLSRLFEAVISGHYTFGFASLADFTTLKKLAIESDFKEEIVRLVLTNKEEVREKIISAIGNNGFEFARFVKEICDANPSINEQIKNMFAKMGVS